MAVSPRNPGDSGALAVPVRMVRMGAATVSEQVDFLAVEEPLEIRLGCSGPTGRTQRVISVTMRTPGHDAELAVGYLCTEGIIATPEQVSAVHECKKGSVVRVELRSDVTVDLTRLERNFYTTSSCGVCGKTSLEAVRIKTAPCRCVSQPILEPAVIRGLPQKLRAAQVVFDSTGGLHAAALFNNSGKLLCIREDVGRHNALDKLIGAQFMAGQVPLSESVLLVSGRASFELVQKAVMAGIPVLAAVGAPSSLAVRLAEEHGLTVLGFVREDRFNIYTAAERIHCLEAAPRLSIV